MIFYRLQMKAGSEGERVAEHFLSINRITADLDYSGQVFDNLNTTDVIMIHKGAFPLALVRILSKVPEDQISDGSFGVDYNIEILSYYDHLGEEESQQVNLYGSCPRTGTFSSINQGNETFNKISRWYNIINQARLMQKKIDILKYKKQIILQGPPGTGKTRLAKQIAQTMTQPVEIVSPLEKINTFIQQFKPSDEQLAFRTRATELLQEFNHLFPKEQLSNLTLEQYAIGTGRSDNFCWWIERGLKGLGYYFPGSARSYLIYWNKADASYKKHGSLLKGIEDPNDGLRNLLEKINQLVTTQSTEGIKQYLGDGFMLKILHSYYPDQYFPINSISCIDNVLKILGLTPNDNDPITKNKTILNFLIEKKKEFNSEITPYEFMGYLFATFDLKGKIELASGHLVTKGEYQIIQFHPSYSYEDFVRGISVKSDEGKIHYQVEDKTLIDFAQKALDSPSANFVLIIDEINRANLPSVLGELIYALEYRFDPENERETSVSSMYQKELEEENLIKLPNNLFIIGTMNTSDRSVGHIDYAIRRRFAFIDVLPEVLTISGFQKETFTRVSSLFISNFSAFEQDQFIKLEQSECLNDEFRPEDVWLGHSYFINPNGLDFNIRKKYEILPILKEYVKDGILKDITKTWEVIDELAQ